MSLIFFSLVRGIWRLVRILVRIWSLVGSLIFFSLVRGIWRLVRILVRIWSLVGIRVRVRVVVRNCKGVVVAVVPGVLYYP